MKKLTLNVDDLRVESFITSPAMQRHGGTVRAYGYTGPEDCLTRTFPQPEYTVRDCTHEMTRCNATCAGDTCPGSTEWGANSCDDMSCAGMCASDNCETFDCP